MERWKEIKGYEGLYEISDLGRIKNIIKNKFKAPNKNKNGYLYVDLWKNNKSKKYTIHRLVATTFIENINNFCDVNHKDGNKSNNNVDNLEWCDRSYNLKEAYRLKLRTPSKAMLGRKGKLCPNSKKINQYDKQGNLIRLWYSSMDIERELKIPHTNISACCLNKTKTCKGYIWRFANE